MSDDLLGLQADCITSGMSPDDIMADLESNTLKPNDITLTERRRCIFHLWATDQPLNHKAHLFGISVPMVYKDLKWLKARLAEQMDELDVKALAGEHMTKGLATAKRLIASGNYIDAWQVRRQLLSDMQSLGFVAKAPTRIQVEDLTGYEGRSTNEIIEERDAIDATWETIPEGEQDAV